MKGFLEEKHGVTVLGLKIDPTDDKRQVKFVGMQRNSATLIYDLNTMKGTVESYLKKLAQSFSASHPVKLPSSFTEHTFLFRRSISYFTRKTSQTRPEIFHANGVVFQRSMLS